jgi:hypothetical protein
MKCRHYRPEPALSPLFLAEGTAPLLPGATGHLTHRRTNWLIWARALLWLFERVEAGPSYPREAISRRSSRVYAAGGGARAAQGTHTLRSVTVTVVSVVCGDQHSPNPLLIPERRACQVAPAGSSALPPCCEGAHDESSSAPGSPAPRMSEGRRSSCC